MLSSKSKNIGEYVKKFHVEIVCAILFMCLLLRLVSPIFALIAFVIALAGMIYEFDVKGLYYIAFLYPFRFIFRYKNDDIYLFVLLIAMWICIMSIRILLDKKLSQKNNLKWFIVLLVLILYILFPRNGISGFIYGIKLSLVIISVFILGVYKEELNIKYFLLVFIGGIITSSVMALFRSYIPSLDSLVGVYITFSNQTRFMGLDRDPNYYTISLLVSMSMMMVVYLKNKISWYIFFPISSVLLCFGFMTISKSFILAFAGVCLFFLITDIIIKRKKSIFDIGLMLLIILLSMAICYSQTQLLFSRLNISDTFTVDGTTMNEYFNIINPLLEISNNMNFDEFTTGRFNIWKSYFNEFENAPIKLVFGHGFGEMVNERASHNTIIQGVYSIGVIGIIYLLIVIIFYLKSQFKNKFCFYEILPFLTYFTLSMALDLLTSTSQILYLYIAVFSINSVYEPKISINIVTYFKTRKQLYNDNCKGDGDINL